MNDSEKRAGACGRNQINKYITHLAHASACALKVIHILK